MYFCQPRAAEISAVYQLMECTPRHVFLLYAIRQIKRYCLVSNQGLNAFFFYFQACVGSCAAAT